MVDLAWQARPNNSDPYAPTWLSTFFSENVLQKALQITRELRGSASERTPIPGSKSLPALGGMQPRARAQATFATFEVEPISRNCPQWRPMRSDVWGTCIECGEQGQGYLIHASHKCRFFHCAKEA
jgi:hypothetical protein